MHRVITEWDAAGWRPSKDELDRYGREIPDDEYQTKDFERVVALRARTEAIARHLTDFLKKTDRFAKTIVFCVDQEHAAEMRQALFNLNADLVQQYPDYVCRVTADEGDIGRGHLSRFQDVETKTPVILTTSQLLTTGVDAPTCKNVVLARVVGSMTEFKQIIGRGTRVRDDYGKLWFNILDYTGSATRLFADPDFDGDPAWITEEEDRRSTAGRPPDEPGPGEEDEEPPSGRRRPESSSNRRRRARRRKFYFDGGQVEIAAHLVYELDPTASSCGWCGTPTTPPRRCATLVPDRRTSCASSWADPDAARRDHRAAGGARHRLRRTGRADRAARRRPLRPALPPAFNAPLRTRRERAQRLRAERKDFFDQYGPEARQILDELLEKYAEHGDAQFVLPDVLKVPPICTHGSAGGDHPLFGGADQLRRRRERTAERALCRVRRKISKKAKAQTAPLTTAQTLGSLLKSARDIMRKDKGLNGDLDRLPLLTWIMFLKFLDDLEQQREEEAKLAGKKFRPAIEPPYRWRDWAANVGRHHRRRTARLHQPGRSHAARRQARARACSPICAASPAPTATTAAT